MSDTPEDIGSAQTTFGDELIGWMRVRLLPNIIIFNCLKLLRLNDTLTTTALVVFLITCFLYLLALCLSKIFDPAAPLLSPAALLTSFLTAFSFGVIKILYDAILLPNANNLPAFFENENGLDVLRQWFRTFLSIKKQLSVAIILGLLGVLTLFLTKYYSGITLRAGSYFLIFSCAFAVGHGAYCAIAVPTLAKAISEVPTNMFWLYPADSPWVRIASSAFIKLSMADTVIVFLCVLGLYFLGPQTSVRLMIIAAVWLLVGVFTVSYSLLYPRYYLQKAITAEKLRQMAELQSVIASYRNRIANISEAELKILSELGKVYDRVSDTKVNTMDVRVLVNLIPSIGIPLLTFILTLITLWKTISGVMPIIVGR
jgi:hypothetical protein